jgi:hypothetical protein
MKYVKTFENFDYNEPLNEEFLNLFKTGRDKMKKALDAVLNSEKAKDAVQKFYESLPDKDKKAAEELVKKTGNKTDEQLEERLLGEAEQATGKKPEEVEKLDKELETEVKSNENYKFDSDAMINEELSFRLMFDKFLTKISTVVGSLGIIGGAIIWFTTCAGAASGVFAALWPIVTAVLGSLAPLIALIIIVIAVVLLARRAMIFFTRHPATGERCNSWAQWSESGNWRDYYDEKTDRYVFPSMPDKSFHLSELKADAGPDETYVDFWRAKFDKGEWDGKDKLGNLLPAYAKKESFRNKMKSFRRF